MYSCMKTKMLKILKSEEVWTIRMQIECKIRRVFVAIFVRYVY